MLDAVLKTIKSDALLENTLQTGEVLMRGLRELEGRYPQYLSAARGRGTFCAIDCDSGARRDQVLARLRARGVHCGGCGEAAIRSLSLRQRRRQVENRGRRQPLKT